MRSGNLIFLGSYLKNYKFKLSLVFLALLISAGSVLSIGVAVRYFVNEGVSGADINKMAASLAVILLVLATASATRSYFITEICEKVSVDVNRDVYKKLLYASVSYFEYNNVADIVSRLTNDTQFIQNVITSVFSFFLRNIIMLVGGVTLLLITNATLTFYVVAAIPAVILPIILLSKKLKVASKDSQYKLSRIASHIEETLAGIKTVQLNNAEDFENKQMNITSSEYLRSVMHRSFKRSTLIALVMGVSSISTLSVLWVGMGYVLDGIMTSGDLVSFIFYSIVVASSMGGMSEVISDINKASGAAERITELYSVEKSNKYVSRSELINENSQIEFENVSFVYPTRPEKEVLSNVSFLVQEGHRVVLSGRSGSGKTTIVDLLLGFYKPRSGKILIGGISIRDIGVSEIRRLIGVVSQETLIFSNTVLFNISYGHPGSTKEEVVEAAKIANIHDFIMTLPRQYETHLGEKGVQLSGGQRQRISIARAILKDPKILVLDEATSNLDEDNTKIVYKSLDSLMKNRTVLIISHRSNFLNSCDKILSLSGGDIKELEKI
jgi:ATP-binding cassette, subfamily B, bacterial